MMVLAQNQQKMYYANQDVEVPVYEDYTDEDGNKYPIDTGEKEKIYGKPVEFFGNIAMSGGEAEAVEFGLDLSQYSAVLILPKGMLPLTETSRIWHNTEPTVDINGYVNEFTADYRVVKISPSLNFDKFILEKVVK